MTRQENEQAAARQFYVETTSREEKEGMLIIDLAMLSGLQGDDLFAAMMNRQRERQAHYWRRHRAYAP